ncbi:S1 RNA-binding domain-containing protein [Fusobacterium sp. MFO224]|uniref:CvfB family protein n=1 Tax=Fusobacterium sp. MFO224 TaxID=3378070 RepID=UPI003853A993
MIKIGKRQKLKVNNYTPIGLYLDAETGDERDNILLPKNEFELLEEKPNVGDELDVFIYRDSEDRLIATLRTTYATVGTIKKLEVTDINPKIGAFLDWGLKKDLLLPRGQEVCKLTVGEKYLVGIYEDKKGRVSATMKIYNFLLPCKDYSKNDIVKGTVYSIDENIGVFVAVDDRYFGLMPNNEFFKTYEIGDEITARVIRVREDGKLDISPRLLAYQQMDEDEELILEKMKLLKDAFYFNDKSSPKEIYDYFGISKKAFKRAIGGLLKKHLITKTPTGFKMN